MLNTLPLGLEARHFDYAEATKTWIKQQLARYYSRQRREFSWATLQ